MTAVQDEELVELLETLYQSSNPTRRWLHCSRRDWIFATLRAMGPFEHALEVGPGAGIYIPVLAELATEVDAADIDQACLTHARKLELELPNLSCIRDDIINSQLPEDTFDLILCSEVIEHIPDSQAALRGMHRLLSRQGKIVLSTPQRYCPLEICAKVAYLPGIIQVVRWIYGEAVHETGHINLLTEKQLRAQLAAAGLEIVSTHKTGFYIPLLAEFGGNLGKQILSWLEETLRDGIFSGLLWTQYYVLRKQSNET